MASFGASEPARPAAGGITGNPIANQRIMAGGRPELPSLPPDASSTLFVEGLPSNCTRREVSRILIFLSIITFNIIPPYTLVFIA